MYRIEFLIQTQNLRFFLRFFQTQNLRFQNVWNLHKILHFISVLRIFKSKYNAKHKY